MDKSDAEAFQTICSVSVILMGHWQPLIYNLADPYYKEKGISLRMIDNLESLGLVKYTGPNGRKLEGMASASEGVRFPYLPIVIGEETIYPIQNEGEWFPIGVVDFTPAGERLAEISAVQPAPSFSAYLTKFWNSMGMTVCVHNQNPTSNLQFQEITSDGVQISVV
jgi:hypothetical protein